MPLESMTVDSHVFGRGLAAINDGRHKTLLAGLIGGALARTRAHFRGQFLHLTHSLSP